ncbi:MAG: starch-binding protein [Eubacteriales bacterium]|nr:starch-binding protein [Eubacteriales bacterium]
MKKFLSIAIALCIMLSCVITPNLVAVETKAAQVDTVTVSASTGPQSTVQGAAILHCFNWSYNNIKNNLQAIKDAGYTAVQTSPVQQPKDYNSSWRDQKNQWWKLYQPLNFSISNNSWLGNKNELKSLCDAAESMGIKVIVDVVANHVSGNTGYGGYGSLDGNVDGSLKRWEYYHDYGDGANDGSRYAMTMGHIGMPDLNTGHGDVQRIVKNFLVECVNVGVDGFRFDAAKHIELPTDDGNRSDFWPNVLNGAQSATSNQLFFYGEILNGCGTDIGNYTRYMSITDNFYSDAVLMAANNSNPSGLANSHYNKGATPDKNVLWVESHDTYMGESGSGGMGNTSGVSDDKVIKAWAMVGSRADATSLFFARPAYNMGDASSNTTYKSKPVAEVNKFKNYFAGQSEYLSSEGSIAYNERGTSGVVLVNAHGTNASVNVRANKMANGTYKDAVSGNTFTVSNGRITGNIGNTGVAVVYNPSSNPTPNPTQPTQRPTTPTQKPTTPAEKYLVGDVDLSENISIVDATSLQRFVSKSVVFNEKQKLRADVDINGEVTILDATLIQQYVAGIKSASSKCGEYVEGGEIIIPPTEPVLPQGNYIYYKNTNNWSNVQIYYWSDENTGMISWPGEQMQSLGNNVYAAELPQDAKYVIFNNGQQQTDNINLQGFGKIYDNGSWSNYGGVVTPDPTVAPSYNTNDKYIYYKNNDNWNEVKVHYWGGSSESSWPGLHMEPIGDNVYRCEIPSDATMVVFNNNNQGQQTQDIRLEGFGKIYSNGSWSNYAQ